VRAALNGNDLGLAQIIDRRALLVELSYEPLYLALFGMLLIGMAAVVALALLGNLLTSWWSVRRRLLQFVVLRALGSSTRQVTTVLLWEQSLIYTAAVLLGALFGLVLAWLVAPALIFTGVPGSTSDTATFLISQSVPPVRLVFSPWLLAALAALLLLCLLALWVMVTTVMRALPARLLRMSED
jgi:ABC-type antimicrobial peptide transport system permease subunit